MMTEVLMLLVPRAEQFAIILATGLQLQTVKAATENISV